MSTIIIVENLSKKYILNHQQVEPYTALRDVMAREFKSLGKSFVNMLTRKASHVSHNSTHEDFWALKDISFEIRQGDRVGVIGRNGAGKSTLLKVLSRITYPTSGRVAIYGRIASLLEVGTGFHPELTGRENIFLNGAILGMSKSEIKRKFDEIVSFAEVEKFLDTPVKRYSSGMYVRLAFAVAAHLEPEILIVDEVLAVGDVLFQKKCLGKMEAVGKEGRTILFVSHNMGAISRLCSNCILLHHGKIVCSGITKDVVADYLSTDVVSGTVYEQGHKPGKAINLRKVVLNPDGDGETNELVYDQPIRIRVEYEVNRSVFNCTVWLAIETIEGIMAFTTADYDQNPAMLENREVGYYQSDIYIPEKWLNAGRYNVIAGCVKNHPLEVYDRVEALTFHINDLGTPASILEVGTRRGVLQPVLQWDLKKVG